MSLPQSDSSAEPSAGTHRLPVQWESIDTDTLGVVLAEALIARVRSFPARTAQTRLLMAARRRLKQEGGMFEAFLESEVVY